MVDVNPLKNLFKAVSKQSEFIQNVLKKGNVYVALSIGFCGVFFYAMLERLSSFSEHNNSLLQMGRILMIEIVSTCGVHNNKCQKMVKKVTVK